MHVTTPSRPTAWCIVSVYRPDLLGAAQHALRTHPDIDVIVDRRIGERRRPERAQSAETRARDRRYFDIDAMLRASGYAIVIRTAAP